MDYYSAAQDLDGFFRSYEGGIRFAFGVCAGVLFLLRGANWLLHWMDRMDWIIIPNKEAVREADARLLRVFLEVQAVVEPEKHIVVEEEAKRQDRVNEDDEAGGDGPR